VKNVTLSFPNLSYMAYFIIDCGIADFVPNWKNASLTGTIKESHVAKALARYDAYIFEREITNIESDNLH